MVSFEEAVSDVSAGNLKIPQSELKATGAIPVIDQGKALIAGYTDRVEAAVKPPLPVIVFGDHTRILKFVDSRFAMGADGTKLLSVREGFDPKFVYRFLKSVRLPSAGYSRHYKFLKEVRIPRPPIPEQSRIAAILDQTRSVYRARQQALDLLETAMDAHLLTMFRDPAETTPLADLATFRYGTSNKATGGGLPTLRIPNVVNGVIDTRDLKTVVVSEADQERLRLHDGDLLFVRTNGNPNYVGRCAVFSIASVSGVTPSSKDWIFASYLIRARFLNNVEPEYVAAFLSTAAGRRQLRDRSRTSAGQYNISIEGLSGIAVPAAPIAQQREFVRQLAQLQTKRDSMERALALHDELFASLEHRAFRGEL